MTVYQDGRIWSSNDKVWYLIKVIIYKCKAKPIFPLEKNSRIQSDDGEISHKYYRKS